MSGIAEVHPEATLSPGKLDIVKAWLPSQKWFTGDPEDAEVVGSFRFVDPAGEVGIETLLVRVGERVYQVPLTYRGEPLEDETEYLIGELEHSMLGHRWVYDATGDPCYTEELNRVIREGDTEADLSVDRPKTVTVLGSGVLPVSNSTGQMKLHRVVEPAAEASSTRVEVGTLQGTWDDGAKTAVLASLY